MKHSSNIGKQCVRNWRRITAETKRCLCIVRRSCRPGSKHKRQTLVDRWLTWLCRHPALDCLSTPSEWSDPRLWSIYNKKHTVSKVVLLGTFSSILALYLLFTFLLFAYFSLTFILRLRFEISSTFGQSLIAYCTPMLFTSWRHCFICIYEFRMNCCQHWQMYLVARLYLALTARC